MRPGEIVGWRHDVWSNGHVSRPGRAKTPTLIAASQLAQPFERMIATNPPIANGGGAERNSVPNYDFPAWEITSHRLLDDADPHLVAAHARRVCQRVRAGVLPRRDGRRARRGSAGLPSAPSEATRERGPCWRRRRSAPAGPGGARATASGYGLGFARYKNAGAYCAVIAEVEGSADIRVRRLVIAVDVGEVINPDGVINQIEGGAIQATSWTLKEAVRFDRTRITERHVGDLSDPALLGGAGGGGGDPRAADGAGDGRRRGGARANGGGHCQRRVRCARRARARSADHARAHRRGHE